MQRFQSGHFVKQRGYHAFIPTAINRPWQLADSALLSKLSKADRFIGRLDAFSDLVNIEFYVRMHVAKEATLSSKIEGTRTNVTEAIMQRADIAPEQRDDWEEVQNYIRAMNRGMELRHQLPFSSRLIRELHALLMSGVRGQRKQPGEFRRSQNWIGGSTLKDAHFVPPPHEEINRLMSDLEVFANDISNPLPDLLKIALIHYQFETIHPFLDGNGRIGRLLVTLYLVEREILQRPILYLSAYFEANRQAYYDHLTTVRTQGALLEWFHFFLDGIIEAAGSGVSTFRGTMELREDLEKRIHTLGSRSGNALMVLRELFAQPVRSVSQVQEIIGSTPTTAYRLINEMVKLDVLREVDSPGRGKRYALWQYLELFAT